MEDPLDYIDFADVTQHGDPSTTKSTKMNLETK